MLEAMPELGPLKLSQASEESLKEPICPQATCQKYNGHAPAVYTISDKAGLVEELQRVVIGQVRRPGVDEELHEARRAADRALHHAVPLLAAARQARARDVRRAARLREDRLHDLAQLRLEQRGASAAKHRVQPDVRREVRQQRDLRAMRGCRQEGDS